MANSRKDKRGYVLRTGECQRTDGRYSYSYTDKYGERHVVYAKDLAELRKKERKIIRDMEDGIDTHAPEKITLNQLYDKYISLKVDLKPTTRANYKYMYDHFVRPKFGRRKIADIKYTDVKKFYYDLIMNKEMKAYTLDNVHTQIHPTLQMAVRDGLLRTNPSDGVMAEIKKSHVWDKEPRRALTIPQQRAFTGYMQNSREYHGWVPVIMILLGTGMRIGDADGKISLNQQKPSKHAGLRRFGPEKFLQRNNEFMKERPIFYKKPIKTEKDFSTWLRCFYYTTKAVITEYIYF